jgi:hypothetical protein
MGGGLRGTASDRRPAVHPLTWECGERGGEEEGRRSSDEAGAGLLWEVMRASGGGARHVAEGGEPGAMDMPVRVSLCVWSSFPAILTLSPLTWLLS